MTFEDPTDLARCILSDCEAYRAGNTPFCARHLRDQETKAPGISEPELEARLATIRSEDDDHPGERKIYNDDGTSEWVADDKPARLYMGPDPDTVHAISAAPPTLTEVARFPAGDASHRGEVKTYHDDGTTEWVPDRSGCWVAHAEDWTALVLFDDELEALRHAVAKGMTVRRAGWGEELGGGG